MSPSPPASYDLATVQALVRSGAYVLTQSSLDGAGVLRLDVVDVRDCVLQLDEGAFYKTMASEKIPGLMQDVYRPRYEGHAIYLKLQISRSGHCVVISFKRDESR